MRWWVVRCDDATGARRTVAVFTTRGEADAWAARGNLGTKVQPPDEPAHIRYVVVHTDPKDEETR